MEIYTVGVPIERTAIHVLGPLPQTEQGNGYILMVMDYFSKWVEIHTMPEQSSVMVAHLLVPEVFCRYGVTLQIHMDQGCNFESELFKETCRLLEKTTVHQFACDHLCIESQWQKRLYDERSRANSYIEGKKVWLYNPQRRKTEVQNSTLPGITKQVTDVVYWIQKNPRWKLTFVHHDSLKPSSRLEIFQKDTAQRVQRIVLLIVYCYVD